MPLHRFATAFPAGALLVSPLLLAAIASPAPAQSRTLQAVAYSWIATAGTEEPAYLVVQLSNPDGSPKTDARLPGPKPGDPTSGLELKNSPWSFETIFVPQGYASVGVLVTPPADVFHPATMQKVALTGQLRLMEVSAGCRTANQVHPGLYCFKIQPMFGFTGGQKRPLPWIKGEYIFRISYRDPAGQVSTIGKLQIP